MYARWRVDTLNIDFDVFSILCGVNDVGSERRLGIGNDIEKYESECCMKQERLNQMQKLF